MVLLGFDGCISRKRPLLPTTQHVAFCDVQGNREVPSSVSSQCFASLANDIVRSLKLLGQDESGILSTLKIWDIFALYQNSSQWRTQDQRLTSEKLSTQSMELYAASQTDFAKDFLFEYLEAWIDVICSALMNQAVRKNLKDVSKFNFLECNGGFNAFVSGHKFGRQVAQPIPEFLETFTVFFRNRFKSQRDQRAKYTTHETHTTQDDVPPILPSTHKEGLLKVSLSFDTFINGELFFWDHFRSVHKSNRGNFSDVRVNAPLDLIAGTIRKCGPGPLSFSSLSVMHTLSTGNPALFLNNFGSVLEFKIPSTAPSVIRAVSGVHTRVSLLSSFDATRKQLVFSFSSDKGKMSVNEGVFGVGSLLSVAASSTNGLAKTRFDRICKINPLNDSERRQILSDWFNLSDCKSDLSLLEDIVTYTRGINRSELLQRCREGVLATFREGISDEMRLQIIRNVFQTTNSSSLKRGLIGDVSMDINVMGPKQLFRSTCVFSGRETGARLRSFELHPAWDAIEAAILTPFCRSQDLSSLLNKGDIETDEVTAADGFSGILLTGASAYGEVAIVRYCATMASSKVPSMCFLGVNCVSLVHKEIGSSERAVKRLFELARDAAPCIVLLDGIESIAPVRGSDSTSQGTMDRILSTLLTEMDGIDKSASNGRIAVFGVTENPEWIDPALYRPGRLERCVSLF